MADSTTNLDGISPSQAQKEVTANALFDAGSPATAFGRRASTSSALTWGYYGGVIVVSGTPTKIDNGTIALTPSATNYLYTTSAGVVTKATSAPSGWPGPLAADAVALYEIVTNATGVDPSGGYIDWRPWASVGPTGATGPSGPTGPAGPAGTAAVEPTGTGFHHSTSGATDGSARAVDVSGTDVTGTLAAARMPALTGDVTTSAGAVATTLATVNSNVGSFGDGTHVAAVTVNAKGLVTAASSVAITGAAPSGSAGGDLTGTYPNPTIKASVSLTTPALNVATATSINKVAITAPASSATLTIADGKTLTASNSITLAGTDSTTMTFPPASASIGYLNVPQNSQSAAYTTVLADAGKHLLHPSGDANARTFTIDSNANVAYPVGTAITFVNQTSQVLSIAITTDTLTLAGTTTTGTRSLAQNGIATAMKVASTSWIISGTGLT